MLNADKNLKQFFSISEVASHLGVSETLLRFWEKEFPTIIKPQKGARGIRKYTQKDIDNISTIYHLVKERGMTLDGARKAITSKRGVEAFRKQVEVIERLKSVRDELQAIGRELNDMN
ncbi:MAG: MerR family transcriptional regulator [Bacteroidaceae bacterium]|nr:MerR family transcriptional regulator [Bacteroidaceae bacterium]